VERQGRIVTVNSSSSSNEELKNPIRQQSRSEILRNTSRTEPSLDYNNNQGQPNKLVAMAATTLTTPVPPIPTTPAIIITTTTPLGGTKMPMRRQAVL